MPNFVITSRRSPRFRVSVADCSREHAQSVLDQLLVEPTAPSDLVLKELDASAQPKRTLADRILRR